uniref:Uncharacterized protein n=1 Tax=Arundo donax TaxID=35708 RepID=A0A0A9FT67_ARUDO
MLFSSVLK